MRTIRYSILLLLAIGMGAHTCNAIPIPTTNNTQEMREYRTQKAWWNCGGHIGLAVHETLTSPELYIGIIGSVVGGILANYISSSASSVQQ